MIFGEGRAIYPAGERSSSHPKIYISSFAPSLTYRVAAKKMALLTRCLLKVPKTPSLGGSSPRLISTTTTSSSRKKVLHHNLI